MTGIAPTSRRFVDLTAPEVRERLGEDSVFVLPVGALEQHGPHLPLSTDLVMAEEVAAAAVAQASADGVDAWLLPALAYAKSDEHDWAAGTLWLTAETLLDTLTGIGRSLATTPARKLLFVNGHGGNVPLLGTAARELRRRFGLQTFLGGLRLPGGDGVTGPDECGLGIHAGFAETSVMLHLRPELVHLERGRRSVPDSLQGWTTLGIHSKPVTIGWLSDDFGTDGTIGDPTGATAERGKELFDATVRQFATALEEIVRFTPERPTREGARA
ncbi:creatininase family protein [Herbiconiux sp. YIM B11900]|uniref:creatininase family protein n=1 Tax=Herbiconiux sp. YIM B11900 TaxID=3404131 RepID=UPI003F861D61